MTRKRKILRLCREKVSSYKRRHKELKQLKQENAESEYETESADEGKGESHVNITLDEETESADEGNGQCHPNITLYEERDFTVEDYTNIG